MKRRNRRILWIAVAVALVALLVWAMLPKPVAVDTVKIGRGRFEQVIEEEGRTRVRERYVVNAPAAGQLRRIELRAGDAVEEGDLLARIAPAAPALLDVRTRGELVARVSAAEDARAQALASVRRAEAATAFARAERDRSRVLVEQGAIARREVDRSELELQTAMRELQAARASARVAAHDLEVARAAVSEAGGPAGAELEVRAPAAGRVLRVARESAGFVGPGDLLMELGDPGALEVVVDVLTEDAVRFAPGAAARLVRWGGPEAVAGKVRLIEPSAFTKVSALGVEEQRVNAIIDPDPASSPPEGWGWVRDGYRVETRIAAFAVDGVVTVPVSALFRKGDGWAAYVIDGSRARLRAVRIGRSNGVESIVESGLAEGDTVVVHPPDALGDGARVQLGN